MTQEGFRFGWKTITYRDGSELQHVKSRTQQSGAHGYTAADLFLAVIKWANILRPWEELKVGAKVKDFSFNPNHFWVHAHVG